MIYTGYFHEKLERLNRKVAELDAGTADPEFTLKQIEELADCIKGEAQIKAQLTHVRSNA